MTSKSTSQDGPSAETKAAYRAILESADEAPLTEGTIRFPWPIGPHTYSLNDEVVFQDRGHGYTGPITAFERHGGHVYATVRHPEGYGTVVDLRKALFIDHPDAAAMAAPVTHLKDGTVVRVTIPAGKTWGGMTSGDLGVVTADKGQLVNVVKLGGDDSPRPGYARLTHDALTPVKLDPRTGVVTE